MPVPDFQSLLLPMLRFAADGKDHSLAEAREVLAKEFNLTPEELASLLPSGRQAVFANRAAWAKVYLAQAGLLTSPKRGHFVISSQGVEVLKDPPHRIDIKYLERFPQFVEFRYSRRREAAGAVQADETETSELATPEETLENAYSKLRGALAADLLAKVKSATPEFFEKLVVTLLLAMGYGGSRADAGRAIGRGGDGGIDGIIDEDRLGLDAIYIQAKRWEGSVGRPEIQKFVGALHGQRARKGVFITTSAFTNDAVGYANRVENRIVLIDGRRLAELMIDFGVGVSVEATYVIKKIDSDFFEE
ncbi:MAG: restriction endonuclease [Thermoanaerobaculia bacterium]